jgi:hypothetical protein
MPYKSIYNNIVLKKTIQTAFSKHGVRNLSQVASMSKNIGE